MSEIKVKDYMTKNVEYIYDYTTVKEAIEKLVSSRHYGFPVVNNGNKLEGFITSKELLRARNDENRTILAIIKKGTYTATPEMDIDDAARIIFRWGLRDLPVIDNDEKLIGIISNLDIVRSHFDRVTPSKITTVVELLKAKYKPKSIEIVRQMVDVNRLVPTQWTIYLDELEGRKYELERGLAEPLIVINRRGKLILVDGHHRALAAKGLGLKELAAFVIYLDTEELLGMEKTALEKNIHTLDDINIEKRDHHPLVEVTTRLFRGSEQL